MTVRKTTGTSGPAESGRATRLVWPRWTRQIRPASGWKSLLRPPEDNNRIIEAARQLPVRGVVRAFWPHLRPYRGRLAVLLALLAVGPAVAVAEINLFRHVVDDVLVPADLSPLLVLALLYIGLNLLSALASGAEDYLSTSVSQHFLLGLRTDLFRHALALPQAAHDRRRVGDLVSRLTSDASAVERFMVSGVSSGVTAVLRIVFYTVALLWLSWQLAALSLLVVPALWFVASRFARLVKVVSRERMRRSGSASAIAEEHLGAVPLVQAYGREDDAVASFRRQHQGIVGAELAASRVRSMFTPAVDLAELIAVLGVIGFGTWALSTGWLTLGGLLAFLALLTQLYSPLRDITRLVPSLFAATAGAERILELQQEQPLREAPGAVELHGVRGAIGLHNASVRYPGATHDAVRGVDLDVAPGEVLALVGPSGAGKSTLVRLLSRLMDPTDGSVTIDGHDLRDITMRSLRMNVSYLLQETLLLDTSIRENIAFARPTASEGEIVSAAHAAAAHEFIQALPAGYETTVGQRGRGLSGGQRQRVAIARAILRDAPILILDEPTTGLDDETARRVLGALREFVRDRTTILVTHDPVALQLADRIVHLEAGRIVDAQSTIAGSVVVA